jgi:hypothetical protein
MENIIIDQRFQIQKLEAENKVLKDKMTLMYKNWLYDSQRYQELKEKISKQSYNPTSSIAK